MTDGRAYYGGRRGHPKMCWKAVDGRIPLEGVGGVVHVVGRIDRRLSSGGLARFLRFEKSLEAAGGAGNHFRVVIRGVGVPLRMDTMGWRRQNARIYRGLVSRGGPGRAGSGRGGKWR
ncbi:hypothetical protein QE152_g1635 [Popillia japonica]|uniref:Uncharacterized protein n=1 Tax=Popillia japonica TaxID=7064 RepID=A0AAW1N2T1_POPJA